MLYDFGIRLYVLAIRLAALFDDKARRWVEGRRDNAARLARLPQGKPVVWVHCASLGEFEQGRPLIEAIRARHPHVAILLTFFSPSGFELRKDYEGAEVVVYLPPDLPAAAEAFVARVQPSLAIFVKYEFWRNHLEALNRRQIPTVLVSARFRKSQIFFKPWGGAFRQMLRCFSHLFVQDEASAELLRQIGFDHAIVAGDTRVDRVVHLARQAPPPLPRVDAFARNARHILVCGSTWPADEKVLAPLINEHLPEGWKVIIAPHEVDEGHVQALMRQIERPAIRYSEAEGRDLADTRVLVIDNVGILSRLYRYGRIAYIGGGFGRAIHNTLEPMAFGLPVLFGPRYAGFAEAEYLVSSGGGRSIRSAEELIAAFDQLCREAQWEESHRKVQAYIEAGTGATQRIMDGLAPLLQPLTAHPEKIEDATRTRTV